MKIDYNSHPPCFYLFFGIETTNKVTEKHITVAIQAAEKLTLNIPEQE